MEEIYTKDFKILIFGLSNLSIDRFDQSFIYCFNINELKKALMKYRSSSIIIGCHSNQILELDLILLNYSIDNIIVIDNKQNEDEREWLYSILSTNNDLILVDNEKKLMRRLYTTAVRYYHKQFLEYKNKENDSMANLCLLNSLKALDYSTKFI